MTTTAFAAPALPLPRQAVAPAADLRQVTVAQRRSRQPSPLLHDLSLQVQRGEVTTLLSRWDTTAGSVLDLLAGRTRPTWGTVAVAGQDLTRLSPEQLTAARRRHVGELWATYAVSPRLTVRQNLIVARRRAGADPDRAWVERIVDALDLRGMLGFPARGDLDPRRLRWTVARSVALRPSLVLVDDVSAPVSEAAQAVLAEALRAVARQLRVAVVVATQDPLTASYADRVVRLARGRLADDTAAA
jgi:putative ABC transport system ATP-binding protein